MKNTLETDGAMFAILHADADTPCATVSATRHVEYTAGLVLAVWCCSGASVLFVWCWSGAGLVQVWC